MVPGVLLVAEGYLRQVHVQEGVEGRPEEAAGAVVEASCPQEEVAEGVYPFLQKLAWVEEAEGHQGDQGQVVGRQGQEQPDATRREENIGVVRNLILDTTKGIHDGGNVKDNVQY